jgi:RHS repeat-associated protein
LRYRQINPAGATVYYIDQLMEIVNITDVTGVIEEGRGFDAFGKPRNGDWSDKVPATLNSGITDRGFTEHEHLDTHALIHMNGRGYDYGLGRFLSIDPIVQSPGNSQSWNPYSYIMNNPLSGTDPSGYSSDVKVDCAACNDRDLAGKGDSAEFTVTKTEFRTGSRIGRETSTSGTISVTDKGNLRVRFNNGGKTGTGSAGRSGGDPNGADAGISAINSQQQTTGSNSAVGGGDRGDNSQTDVGTVNFDSSEGAVTYSRINSAHLEEAFLAAATEVANFLGAPGGDVPWQYSADKEFIDCGGFKTNACTSTVTTLDYRGNAHISHSTEYSRGAGSPGKQYVVGRGNLPVELDFENGFSRALFLVLHERFHTTGHNQSLPSYTEMTYGMNREIDANLKALRLYRRWKGE